MSARRTATPLKYTPEANASETGLISPNTPVVVNSPVPRFTGVPPQVTVGTPRYSPLTSNSPRTTPRQMNAEILPAITPPVVINSAVPVNAYVANGSPTVLAPAPVTEETVANSNTPFQFYGGGQQIVDPVVENELIGYGYLPTQKIMINESNQKVAMFIKATNKFGQPVIIKLDDEGMVVESTSDLTIVKVNTGEIGDYSSRVGEKLCMQTEACGLAYVCNNGMCVMDNGTNGRINETKFEFVKRFSEQDAVIGDEPVAYPVVTLSDIRANPALVLQITNNATKRLRNAAYQDGTTSLIEVRSNIETLNEAFNKFIKIRAKEEKRLMDSICVLESYIKRYEALCIKDNCEELKRHKDVIANLTLRNEKVADLLRAIKSVKDINTPLLEIIKTIKESTCFLETEFCAIDQAYNCV